MMEKSAQINFPVIREIEQRKSIRAFAPRRIEQEKIDSMFEAARWSFSSGNEQAWTYIYAHQDQPLWNDLYECLTDGNKSWCKHAPVLILALARTKTKRGDPYKHNFHDVGASSILMAIQAASLGFQIHPMAGFVPEKAKTTFNIPEDFEPVTMIAAGYAGTDLSALNDRQKESEPKRSERYLQSEFVLNRKF